MPSTWAKLVCTLIGHRRDAVTVFTWTTHRLLQCERCGYCFSRSTETGHTMGDRWVRAFNATHRDQPPE